MSKKNELCAWLEEINRLLSLRLFHVHVNRTNKESRSKPKVIFLNQPSTQSECERVRPPHNIEASALTKTLKGSDDSVSGI